MDTPYACPGFLVGGVPARGNPPGFAAISRFFVLLREQPPSLFGLQGCELFPRAWAISPFLPVTPSLGPFLLLLEPCFD